MFKLLFVCYKHFVTITRHKYFVLKACWKSGLYWQGIVHDLSKYGCREFLESAKYFQGDSSPINAAKAAQGYSVAWQWHKGRNLHHYEFWVDHLDKGGVALIIPYKFAMEMICDWVGAGKAYNKGKWTPSMPLDYYNDNMRDTAKMHPKIKQFVGSALDKIANDGEKVLCDRAEMRKIYDSCING